MSDQFRAWWARNHPYDWLAKHRGGEPMSARDRMLVWDLCRRAFYREEGQLPEPDNTKIYRESEGA